MNLLHTIHEPAGDGPHPTIFVFHGYGANAHDLLGLAPHLLGGKALVIAPQAPVEVPLDPQGRLVGYGWFPLSLGQPPPAADVARSIDAAETFVAAAHERYPIDRDRTALLGFSQGGLIAFALGLETPSRWKALVALSTWLPDDVNDAKTADASNLPVWVQHGTDDEVIPLSRAQETRAKLTKRGMPLTYKEYPMGHEISVDSLRDLVGWLQEHL